MHSRGKGGFGERETQHLAKSTGREAQLINPEQGHLTELVEAVLFNSGYILCPEGKCKKTVCLLKFILAPNNFSLLRSLARQLLCPSRLQGLHMTDWERF